jgi:hypothetical protein
MKHEGELPHVTDATAERKGRDDRVHPMLTSFREIASRAPAPGVLKS